MSNIQSKFRRMGAEVIIRRMTRESFREHQSPLAIDIVNHGGVEIFDIEKTRGVDLNVPDVQSRDRHLVLRAHNSVGALDFLCGHDEMHWFVAALPIGEAVSTVTDAKEALKPSLVKRKEARKRRTKGDVYVRQGEWFFLPCPHASIDRDAILRDAELVRGPGSTPHVCEFMFLDGEREFECDRYPKLVFSEAEYHEVLKTRRKAKRWNWRPLRFEPDRYVKGWITHPDHNPMYLDIWHRVEMNTEQLDATSTLGRPRHRIARVRYRD